MRREGEALVIAMTLVPGLFSRNRTFSLFEDPEVRRARRRATLLRGIVRQLTTGGAMESLRIARTAGWCELSYCLPAMKLRRRASLSDVELACVHYLVSRAGVGGLSVTEQDRAAIDAALQRLAVGLRLGEFEAVLE